jgi:S-adenosylmethionine:tRNA ribosyltransferase-isomerase
MQSSDFDYELPDEKIARHPVNPRRSARLLRVAPTADIEHGSFEDLPQMLSSLKCDGLWVNDTKVLQARLYMQKPTGGRLEIFLLEPLVGVAELALSERESSGWRCLVRGGRKWTAEIATLEVEGLSLEVRPSDIEAGLVKEEGGTFALNFTWDGTDCFGDVLDRLGRMPLPPYMRRESDDSDSEEYQTVFARLPGSVAAPTAGLHYDEKLLRDLDSVGLPLDRLTLHVGAGTFRPLSEGSVNDHVMHAERCVITRSILEKLSSQTRRVATGTTTLRTLESLYWIAVVHKCDGHFPVILSQWTPYELNESEHARMSYTQAMEYLMEVLPEDEVWSFSTRIMIRPGYKIRSVVGLITNFHQPSSTLLCLVSAFLQYSGTEKSWQEVYAIALQENYRFLSYGDGCLFEV